MAGKQLDVWGPVFFVGAFLLLKVSTVGRGLSFLLAFLNVLWKTRVLCGGCGGKEKVGGALPGRGCLSYQPREIAPSLRLAYSSGSRNLYSQALLLRAEQIFLLTLIGLDLPVLDAVCSWCLLCNRLEPALPALS